MVFQRLNSETIAIKIGSTSVQVKQGSVIKVGDYEITGPGEYDIAGIGFHMFASHGVMFGEGVSTTFIWSGDVRINAEEEGSSDIFLVLASDIEKISAMIKVNDPRIIIFSDAGVASQIAQHDGVTIIEEGNYKITSATLPSDERLFVLLV